MLEKFKLFESLRRDKNIADFVILSLYKYGKMSVRDLVNLVHKEWPSEVDRKLSYYSKKNITKTKDEIDEQIRVDLAQVMLDRTLKNPYGRKEFITKSGTYYELNELGIKVAESIISNDVKRDDILPASVFIKQQEFNDVEGMTYLNAAKKILTDSENKPMTSREIWNEVEDKGLIKTSGKTPYLTMNNVLTSHSVNFESMVKKSDRKPRKPWEVKTSIFEITQQDPYKFKLSSISDKSSKDVKYTENPFKQSICVLGESGAGKSTTVEHILEFEGHEFEFIIPSASTTGLLSQFSPSRSGYIPSRLGRMIVEAFNNPTNLYTAVFDECHKSNVIEMINDELLQAISTKRNMGRRFISLDEDTSELYKGIETNRGNILIPDNFGFIFISSKPRIISNNTDFFNRVDLVVLTESDREMKTSEELLSKVLPEEEKMKLASTRND